MQLKHKIMLILFAIICFSPYFLRQDIVGADSYFFLNQVCKENYQYSDMAAYQETFNNLLTGQWAQIITNPHPPLLFIILNNLKCDLLGIKLLLLISFLVSIISIALLGEVFEKENGSLAALFAFLSPLILLEFLKFENDQIAIPILFFAMYLFFNGGQQKENLKRYCLQFSAIILTLIATGFWGGSLLVLIAFGLNSTIGLLFAVPVMLLLGARIFSGAAPVPGAYESTPLLAVMYTMPLLICMHYGARKPYIPQLIFLTALSFYNAKFTILALPLLCICVLKVYNDKTLNQKLAGWNNIKKGIIIGLIILGLSYGFSIARQYPTQDQWNAIDYAIQTSETQEKELINEWGLGYWVHWRDGNASAWGGPQEIDFNTLKGKILLTHQDTNHCKMTKQFGHYKIYVC